MTCSCVTGSLGWVRVHNAGVLRQVLRHTHSNARVLLRGLKPAAAYRGFATLARWKS